MSNIDGLETKGLEIIEETKDLWKLRKMVWKLNMFFKSYSKSENTRSILC